MKMYTLYKPVIVPETEEVVGTGWLPPMADMRDLTEDRSEIADEIKKLGIPKTDTKTLAAVRAVDLRKWCSPIEHQLLLGSCSAQAAAGIVEYFERRAFGKHINCSRLFIYKATRNLMGVTGDTGAWLRTTMGALVHCGAAPERYWPYTDTKPDFDNEPPAFVYAVADEFEALRYFCHDPLGKKLTTDVVLARVKGFLAVGIPSMFGFFVFPSYTQSAVSGGIPFPCPDEGKSISGHAVVAVGYDDAKKITNTECNETTTGAFLIRNSWGTAWGENGYGWLPYKYVLEKLALDFWSLLRMKWVDTGEFGLDV
jgi:C1A family cysteine protease